MLQVQPVPMRFEVGIIIIAIGFITAVNQTALDTRVLFSFTETL